MSWQVHTLRALQDNYIFILQSGSRAIVIDPGESEPVLKFLTEKRLSCEMILLTHHHGDHINGVAEILAKSNCAVIAPHREEAKYPFDLTRTVKDGDVIELGDALEFHVIELTGHTMGHVAYWSPQHNWLFSGDVLFALGCGRVFEGTYENMFTALQKIKNLPDAVRVYCAHDYIDNNRRFCEQYEISIGGYHATHPLSLEQEKAFNPFLVAPDIESFRIVRDLRNRF